MKKITLILTTFFMAGCAASGTTTTKSRQPFNINGYDKRLNIASCNDRDDWYLDGFGVGQKHSTYKQKILNQRINYCGEVSRNFVSTWEDGFNQGVKNAGRMAKRGKKTTKRKS